MGNDDEVIGKIFALDVYGKYTTYVFDTCR